MRKRGKLAYVREILKSYPEIIEKPAEERTVNEQRRAEIVNRALEAVQRMSDSRARRKIIELVYFQNAYTLYGAALQIPVGERTAQRWNAELMNLIAELMDLP
ncbi:MAG: hypothetical protein Q4A63_07800 [Butyricicoccus pullicaecorum]|nr:hypothetical protein [Butyricicoccus pullicaecorum]MDO4669708.1 hypothetical protein [Butyricicoccus pullicaecorum]